MLGLMLLSCERKTSWDLQTGENFLVADCIITNELRQQELRLYWSSDDLNRIPAGFSDAAAELSDGVNTYLLIKDPGEPGRYRTAAQFIATSGTIYRLTLYYNGIYDTAFTEMTGVTPLENIDIQPFDSLFRVVFHQDDQASMTEIYYDWSSDIRFTETYGASGAEDIFYSLHDIDVSREFAPEKLKILFPHNTQIVRRKYSLNYQHEQFIRSLLLETEWRGGFFDAEQGNVPTNFKHGVRGWFAACAVVSDTIQFK